MDAARRAWCRALLDGRAEPEYHEEQPDTSPARWSIKCGTMYCRNEVEVVGPRRMLRDPICQGCLAVSERRQQLSGRTG